MVGIVIVSHSAGLAGHLKELAEQMGQGKARIAAAGGVDDPDNPIGTDAMRIMSGIQEVYSDEGVVVFMDMGSAVMSAEMALDFLEEEQKSKVYLCDGPLVEGVVSAAALAASGASASDIIKEARSALEGKSTQLGSSAEHADGETEESLSAEEEGLTASFTLQNTMGMHARPAAQLVQALTGLAANVGIRKKNTDAGYVSAKSINKLIALGARQGSELELHFSGRDAEQALEKLKPLFENHFGESTAPAAQKKAGKKALAKKSRRAPATVLEHEQANSAADENNLIGLPITPGFAVGPAHHNKSGLPKEVPQKTDRDPEEEKNHFDAALKAALERTRKLKQESVVNIGEEEAAIFDAQSLLLQDPELLENVRKRIQGGEAAAYAWRQSLEEVIELYEQITGDSVISTRIIDLIDVGIRVLEELTGEQYSGLTTEEPSILCMENISPSDAAGLDTAKVLAICCEKGSDISHSAIIARSLGIPTIFNLGPALSNIEEGQQLALNAETGRVYLKPDKQQIKRIENKRKQWMEIREKAHAQRKQAGTTADEERVQVLANIGNAHEINQVLDMGAEGVGLFRSEFIFMGRSSLPTEEEQLQAYRSAAQTLGRQKPLVIRTLDVGGDKPIPYLGIEAEENPFMGLRGIRYSLSRPKEFKTQLRALLRASAFGNISIMFPMIARPVEVDEALQLLETAREELRDEGQPYDEQLKTGIMVEVPAAVEDLERLLPKIDFISIGTNDLCQYMMAADRTNTAVSELSDYFQPVLLRVIGKVIKTARAAGTDVSVCGEMARDPLAMPFLLAAGLRKFSMSAAGIPEFKWRLRRQSVQGAEYMMQDFNKLQTPEEIQRYFKGILEAAM